MKLYTRAGDKGQTGLRGGARVSKASLRVAVYGDIDELNSVIGLARAQQPWPVLDTLLARLQHELFNLGALLSKPDGMPPAEGDPILGQEAITRLEREIDAATAAAPPLERFVLPGGTALAAALHLARTVCRRAERLLVALAEEERVDVLHIAYLNRLSDYFFAAAREANARAGVPDIEWPPRA